ncbi:MAG TPA: acyl-CoA dehydrogenase family protein [Thermoanaerobaculia bacterium]|nr:acyl-CoA dehydrogenase family protein [Thermoanaerobaculia bacterium]
MTTQSHRARTLLLDAAARLFADGATEEVQEQVEDGTFPRELWSAIEDNGLPLALVPEDAGGVGLGVPDAMAVLRLAGAFALPLPLAETMLGQWALASAGLPAAEGPLCVAPGDPRDHFEVERDSARGWIVSGRAPRVSWASPGARCVLVCSETATGGSRIALVTPGPHELAPSRNPAGESQASLVLESHMVADGNIAAAPPGLDGHRLLELFALARTALMAGALERVLDLTLEHAQGRVQFGKPIGRFQAVQQQVAELAGESAIVGAALEAAAAAVEENAEGASFAVAAAKARASTAAEPACAIAHQLHAAIGFTREHVLHRFTRRLWAWRDEAGSESFWWQRAGEQILEGGGAGLWPRICGEVSEAS